MKLHFRTLGTGQPLLIMHGVFGSSDNWQTLGKEFASKFKVYLIDLRNHGKSPHSEEFNYAAMAEDIRELLDEELIEQAHILGHSMGGKVAMQFATQHPAKVQKLIVVDIAPKTYPPHHQQIFEGFKAVDLANLTSRKEADDQMAAVITNFGIRQFILKNLDRNAVGQFQWKLNLEVIERAVDEVGAGLAQEAAFDGETLFIGGGNSDYILPQDHGLIQALFPHAEITSIAGAGHWVHAEKPRELKEQVLRFLS